MSNPPKRRGRALGRGLSALIPGATPGQSSGEPSRLTRRRDYFQAPIEDVYPSPDQPRRRFEDESLDELARSIRAHGVIQPLIVRGRKEGGYYLIAGERRWRASQRAGLTEVPVVVQDVAPKEAFERALVENLQRADLNPIEEAEAYSRLVSEFEYTQEQVAGSVGKDRSTVANSLRLLRLPPGVRAMVEENRLSMGHARALLGLDSPDDIESAARVVVGKSLTVRATEEMVRNHQKGGGGAQPKKPTPQKSASVRDLETRLTKSLGSKVDLAEDRRGDGGKIEIRYANLDDLDRLLELLIRN